MAYVKTNWEDYPSTATAIDADALNHMEDGIVQNETDIAGKMDANNPTGTGSLQVGTGNMKTDGNPSYALGHNAYAEGDNSFAFGSGTRAKKQGAYAIGIHAEAREYYSMALGEEVIAASIHQTARGKYNEIDADGVYLDIVGGGNPLERKNVETLTPNGDKWVAGDYTNGNGETLHGIYEALPVDSASGNPAVITDAFGGDCKSLVLTLEPIQSGSGTPSPANPRPITGRTQSTVKRTGKNLYDVNAVPASAAGIIATISDDGTLDLDGTASANAYFSAYVNLPTSDYVVSLNNSVANNDVRLSLRDINGNYFLDTAIDSVDKVLNISNKSIWMLIIYTSSGRTINHFKMKIQLEAGATATSYALYDGESITRTYGTTIYGGSDDVTGDGVTKTKDLYVPVVSSVGYSASAGCNYADCHGITIAEDSDTICNMYDQIPYGNTGAEGKYKIYPSTVTIYDSRFTDVATAQSILNSCQIVYPLYTPTSIPLTSQNLPLLKGDNVITTDADSIEASYSADIALYIAKKIAEGSQGNRSLSKGGSGDEESKEEEKEEEKKEEEPKEVEVNER